MGFIKGKCRLCEKDNVDLLESHIIPEFLYKSIYDTKHRYIDFTEDPRTGVRFAQKGVRENILCSNCEVLLSKYENCLSDFLIELNTNSNSLVIVLFPEFKYVKKIKYTEIKIALLSILFRMAVSKLSQFDGYTLGPYENAFRDIILNNKYTDRYTFSIHISPVSVKKCYYPDLIMTYEKSSRYNNMYNFHCFIINGYLIEIMLSKVPVNDMWHLFDLREKGKIIMRDIDISMINIKQTLANRYKDNDVRNFIKKLK
jgi:hypothetical protein